jgi:hypothetical protein
MEPNTKGRYRTEPPATQLLKEGAARARTADVSGGKL